MTLVERVDAIAAPLPCAERARPFDGRPTAWTVGGKLFTCIGAKLPGVSVKCADIDTARMLIDAGVGLQAPYFHRSWVHLPPEVDDGELGHRVHVSYDTVRAGLPRRVRDAMPPRERAD